MSYNDKLKSDIIVAKVSISSLEKELSVVSTTVTEYRETLKLKLRRIIDLYESAVPFIPLKMKESIEFFISDSCIRPRWKDYDREGYSNQIDIYYYAPEHYSNRSTLNHRWEISCSGMKIFVNTEASENKKWNEEHDRTMLAIGMSKFIEDNKKHLIEIHNEWSENENKAYTLSSAIDKLKRDIREAEEQMERNDLIHMIKPGGETSIYLFNKEIPMFAEYNQYYYSRRYSCRFNSIKLIKETKKGVKVEFIIHNKDNEGNITQSWVTETKVVDFNGLIGILRQSKNDFAKEEKRRIEKEEREKKALETQNS